MTIPRFAALPRLHRAKVQWPVSRPSLNIAPERTFSRATFPVAGRLEFHEDEQRQYRKVTVRQRLRTFCCFVRTSQQNIATLTASDTVPNLSGEQPT